MINPPCLTFSVASHLLEIKPGPDATREFRSEYFAMLRAFQRGHGTPLLDYLCKYVEILNSEFETVHETP